MTSEVDDAGQETTPITSGRSSPFSSSAGSSVHSEVGSGGFQSRVATASATSSSMGGISPYGPDQQFAALRAGEANDLMSTFPDRNARLSSRPVRTQKTRMKVTAQSDLLSVQDELDIPLHVREEILLDTRCCLTSWHRLRSLQGKSKISHCRQRCRRENAINRFTRRSSTLGISSLM